MTSARFLARLLPKNSKSGCVSGGDDQALVFRDELVGSLERAGYAPHFEESGSQGDDVDGRAIKKVMLHVRREKGDASCSLSIPPSFRTARMILVYYARNSVDRKIIIVMQVIVPANGHPSANYPLLP